MNDNFYNNYFIRYLQTDSDTRKKALDHWKKCHRRNLESKKSDMIIFSAIMIATITLAEDAANKITLEC